uniref:Protein kinase domain-containing protein n=1 Tax=Rhabditophanes sp. KR3021 TaxID=114890 RepID=A0AC35TJ41_9BILA
MKEIVKDKYPRPKFISLFMPEFQICPHMLDHNFIIKGQLGTGAFGSVLEVMKKDENGKRYALKIQEKTKIFLLKNERQIKMEALIQSSMPSHPFIAKFFNTWQSKTHLYTLMEIIEKGDLFTEWDRQNGFSEDLIRIYGAEVALALDFLHSRRIIHRDIKLENIIVDGLGNLKLVDFGLSKILNNNCLANTILGTLQYMAPEIRYGMPYNECVDWWSLGVMMSIMFTCQYPFPVANVKRHEDLTFKGYCSPNGSLSFQIVVGLLKEQIFFRNLNFNAIYQGRIRPILLWKKDDQIQRNKKRRIEKNVGNYFEEFDLTLTDHKEWLGETSDNNCIWERESSGIGSDSKCSDLF